MSGFSINRRKFLTVAGAAASTIPLSGCDAFDGLLSSQSRVRDVLASANSLTYRVQRMLIDADALAPEFSASEVRQGQRPNGSTDPTDADYLALKEKAFADYRLTVGGLVEKPLSFSLEELRNMPARTQITRHDCVEGWSCIAKWTGVPLATILDEAKAEAGSTLRRLPLLRQHEPRPVRRRAILRIDRPDRRAPSADHPRLWHATTRRFGLPMARRSGCASSDSSATRWRNNQAYRTRLDASPFGSGKGGFWEDLGYEWYAGI